MIRVDVDVQYSNHCLTAHVHVFLKLIDIEKEANELEKRRQKTGKNGECLSTAHALPRAKHFMSK